MRMRIVATLGLVLTVLAACSSAGSRDANPRAGAILITRYACGSCHAISGIQQANGMVGPSLNHIGGQKMLAGALPNTAENIARFVRTPRALVKDSVMPDQDLSDAEARDVAAYLQTLK